MKSQISNDDELLEFQKSMKVISNIVLNHNTNPTELKLALSILQLYAVQNSGCDGGYAVQMDKNFLCENSGIDKTNIAKYIKALVQKNVLIQHDKQYAINEELFSVV